MRFRVILLCFISCVSAILEEECLNLVEKSTSIGSKCSDQLKVLCQRHDILFKLWDGSSKFIHTGMTETSPIDIGNYDVCTKLDIRVGKTDILGKYCPNEWVTMIPEQYLEEFVAALEILPNYLPEETHLDKDNKKSLMKNESKNITLIGALCITDGCSIKEFNQVFSTHLYPVIQGEEDICVTKYTKRDLNTFQIVAIVFLVLVAATVVLCTIIDVIYHYRNLGKSNEVIEGFSAVYNGRKLVTVSNDTVNQIQCMNGMRFISILWIIAGHGFVTAQFVPLVNQDDMNTWKSTVYTQYIQSAVFAVDTFFFLSGFLLAFGYLNKMKKRSIAQQITGIPLIYLNRYIRLTPAVGAMFLTSISFFKILGDGPMWFITYDMIDVPCNKYWWRFFLYIQNYFPDDLCFVQTWYLSADMQMFVFAPLVLIPCSKYFEKKTRVVIACLIILIGVFVAISIAIPYTIDGYSNNYDTHSRVSDYLVGIIGGVIFCKNKGKRVKISKVYNIIIWSLTLTVMILLSYANYYATIYSPTKLNTTVYAALYRPIWSTCILWIVFSCYHGYGGLMNWFLSNSLFQVGARLSYCMYVLHGMLVLYFVGISRTLVYFNDLEMINVIWGYIINCIILSIFWTLIFEGPVIMLNKKLFGLTGPANKKNENKQDIA